MKDVETLGVKYSPMTDNIFIWWNDEATSGTLSLNYDLAIKFSRAFANEIVVMNAIRDVKETND